jgi:hypothetical protein
MTRARVALWLWIALAIIVWNVVFDHTLVVAGREYIVAATLAMRAGGPYARMDNWMHPAVVRGLWLASVAAAGILATGMIGIRLAGRPR